MAWNTLLDGKKNIVFLGETGCGKSELAISCALHLTKNGHAVSLFDLDQTKPLMRTREHAADLEASGVRLCFAPQQADAPTFVTGLREQLSGSTTLVLDVGGGVGGARLIAGLSPLLQGEDTSVFFVFNPYRPFSGSCAALSQSLSAISQAARLPRYRLLLNPTLGEGSDAESFLSGLAMAEQLLPSGLSPAAAAVSRTLLPEVSQYTSLLLLPLRPQLSYSWLEDPRSVLPDVPTRKDL